VKGYGSVVVVGGGDCGCFCDDDEVLEENDVKDEDVVFREDPARGRPISSHASRRAVSKGSSSSESALPPGKATCPGSVTRHVRKYFFFLNQG